MAVATAAWVAVATVSRATVSRATVAEATVAVGTVGMVEVGTVVAVDTVCRRWVAEATAVARTRCLWVSLSAPPFSAVPTMTPTAICSTALFGLLATI